VPVAKKRSKRRRSKEKEPADHALDAERKRWLRRRLLTWYERNARILPWRATSDPYAIWVSETMLQQTQVTTVERYFPRFIAEFPTIAALAGAAERDVLRLWEGLGYYRRARQLHAAAKQIVERHKGVFPRDPEQIRALAGIGRYTSGAILSIAFDAREPILEANTIRLLARLTAYRGDPRSTKGQRFLWQVATQLLPRRRVGTFNQALMELGSLICTPQKPDCPSCPLANHCPTWEAGLQEEIPAAAARPKIEEIREAVVVLWKKGRVLLVQRNDQARWGGLWDFPRFRVSASRPGRPLEREVAGQVYELTGIRMREAEHLTNMRHGVTRYKITLFCYEAQYDQGRLRCGQNRMSWVPLRRLDEYPLNTTGRKLAKRISDQEGKRH